jgi:hypothetical protein
VYRAIFELGIILILQINGLVGLIEMLGAGWERADGRWKEGRWKVGKSSLMGMIL